MNSFIKSSFVGITLTLLTTLVNAQSTQLFSPADSVARIELRYLHPFYEELDKQGLLSGGYDFTVSYPINNKWNIQASIPLLFSKYDIDYYQYPDGGYGYGGYGYFETTTVTEKDNAIGNIMIGINSNRFLRNNRVFSFDLQLFLPTSPKEFNKAIDYAGYANLYEFQKYFGDVTSIAAKANYASNPETGWFYSLSGGSVFLIGGSDSGIDEDFCFSYALGAGYKVKSIAFSLDYQGLINLTNDAFNDFRDRMFDAINIGAHYSIGNFQPSLIYSLYTRDDIRDMVTGTLGIKLAYRFAK
jgi:hypothetical protein